MKASKASKDIKKEKKTLKPTKAQKGKLANGKAKDTHSYEGLQQSYHHVETLHVKDKDVPKSLYQITEKNIFEALIFPMKKEEFFERIYAQKSFLIKGCSADRFKTIVETQMFNLNLKKMCKNAASEQIHMWFPNREALSKNEEAKQSKKKNDEHHQHVQELEIKSFGTEDCDLAVTSFERGGASLYFGSSIEFRNLYCKALTYQLGMNFGAYFNDFSTMGEIETFFTKKGNITGFHTDFQENFTLQISGSKRWRLKRSGLKYPTLGYTPHYAKSGNLEGQSKVHLAFNSVDINKSYQDLEEEVYDVVLEEGDILYHPAGIWHEVECLSDESISINFSLRALRVADLITNAQRMLLLNFDETRQGIRLGALKDFSKLTKKAADLSQLAFDPKYIMPPCINIPRVLNYDMDKTVEQNGKTDFKQEISFQTYVKLNPFFVVNKFSEMPQAEDTEDAQFVINGLFGNEDYSSIVRVLVHTENPDAVAICDYMMSLWTNQDPSSKFEEKYTISTLLYKSGVSHSKDHLEVFRALVFNGVLVLE